MPNTVAGARSRGWYSRALLVGMIGGVAVVSCGGGADPTKTAKLPTQILISPAAPSVAVASTLTLTATPKDVDGAIVAVPVVWSTSNAAVALVNPSTGVLTGVSAGTSTITATIAAVSLSNSVVATVTPSPLSTIAINQTSPAVQTGRSTALTATARDALNNIVGATIRWSSANVAVATIDSVSGVATGVAPGTVTMTARSGTVTGSVILSVTAASGVVAALPALTVNSAMPAATAGARTIDVGTSPQLQAAIDTSKPGDIIRLASGITFSGNFTLKRKTGGTAPIIIRTNVSDALMPVEGARMKPTFAPLLAKISTPNGVSAIVTDNKVQNWRVMLVEITATSPIVAGLNALVRIGIASNTFSDSMPSNVIFDRVYAHGTPTLPLIRGFIVSSAATAIVDSYISDCHVLGGDAQAIVGWNGSGPWKFVNNYLEGSGENLMIGGADPTMTGVMPADIEIRNNHFFKPLAWRGVWSVKNLLELKMGRRVLIEGNVLENNWPDAQTGFAMNLKAANENGTSPWVTTADVTVRYNRVRNTAGAISLLSTSAGSGGFPVDTNMRRILIHDNIFEDIGVITPPLGADRMIQTFSSTTVPNSPIVDLAFDHNTFITTGSLTGGMWSVDGSIPAVTNIFFSNNIIQHGLNGVKAGGSTEGTSTVTTWFNGTISWQKNALIGASAGSYGGVLTGQFFPADVASVLFLNVPGKDYRLTAGSPFKNAGSDGKDLGADITTVETKTAGVVNP